MWKYFFTILNIGTVYSVIAITVIRISGLYPFTYQNVSGYNKVTDSDGLIQNSSMFVVLTEFDFLKR